MQRDLLWLQIGKSAWERAAMVALLALAVLTAAAALRSFEYDEAYTFFLTSGVPRPDWPETPFHAGDMRGFFHAQAPLRTIAPALRATDVHPPIYFWAVDLWRRIFGDGLFSARLFSVACTLAALAAVACIARAAGIPVTASVLITLGCYGFTYTGSVARGFALAQALSLWGAALALVSTRNHALLMAGIAGLLLGAATATNYLAVFVAAAVLLWLLTEREFCLFGLAGAGFAAFVPLDLWFFAAQHGSRAGQFPPFAWISGMIRLARCFAGALLGALPLYLSSPGSLILQVALGLFLAGLVLLVIVRSRRIADANSRRLIALGAVAPGLGLLLLGLVFNNTPIEVRYLSFAMPFCALLLAGTAARRVLLALGCIQILSIAGLLFGSETMQPARGAAMAAASLAGRDGLVLLPYGNDGVGVVGPFVAEAPDWLRILVIRPGSTKQDLAAAVSGTDRIILALLGPDETSRGTSAFLRTAFAAPCWEVTDARAEVVALKRTC